MNGIGNGPVVALAFLSSFAVSGSALLDFLVRALVMVAVALLGKGVDVLVKRAAARRRERWRARALAAETELKKLRDGDAD